MLRRFDVVIVGGGSAGIAVAAKLARLAPHRSIAVIEPSSEHYYQPLWTLVGAGELNKEETRRPQKELIPRSVSWIQDRVEEFFPESHFVLTESGLSIHYRCLVVAPGIQIQWDQVEGLKESLGKFGVCSNYDYQWVDKTWQYMESLKRGTAIFTQPSTPIKCGGAPQKIAYLAEDYWMRQGSRSQHEVVFASGLPSIFPVEKYAHALEKVIKRKNIFTYFRHELRRVDGPNQIAYFENLETGEELRLCFEMIHVTPPMGPPDFIRESVLADEDGWVDIDKYSLQHVRFPNIFALGDASNLPTSKTGAAIRKQAPVVVENVLSFLQDKVPTATYDGYTSCPLVTGYGRLILAEFDYEKKPCETFPFDQSKERLSMYLLKKYGLPKLYWRGMMKGIL